MKLAGKVALVTGAQQGIGAAIARALAGEGANVAVSWLDDRPGAEAVARDIARTGRQAYLLKADVSKVADIEVYPRVPLLEMQESDWDYLMDINLKAGCFAAIAVAKALIAAGRKGGSIINLSSQAVRGAVRGVHYSTSKGGVVSMTRAMALELAPHGIRVNAIAPGTTDTAQPRYGNTDAELVEMARANIPLGGKLLSAEQIARTAVFLASDDSDATTGQVLHVNGGSYMP